MGDEQCLAALDQSDGVAHGRAHAGHELGVGLAPARPQGVEVVAPVLGVGQDPSVAVDGHALEVVAGLDEAGVRRRGEVEGGGGRRAGLTGPLQRGGDDRGDVVAGGGQHVGDLQRHLSAQLREVVAGQASVQDALGVVDLAVPHEVDRRTRHSVILACPSDGEDPRGGGGRSGRRYGRGRRTEDRRGGASAAGLLRERTRTPRGRGRHRGGSRHPPGSDAPRG